MMEVLEAIKNRRSIRRYRDAPVGDDIVNTVLEAAHWAPSWGNTQCWRFVVVRDPHVKSQVAGCLHKIMFDNELVDNAATNAIRQAPVLLVFCAEMGKAGYTRDGVLATDKGDWFMFDIALAMENLVVSAHSLGLGTVIVGGFDSAAVARILDVPAGISVVTMTPLGFPDHKGQISPRKELSEVVYHEKYGRR
jgi:nitroreductase